MGKRIHVAKKYEIEYGSAEHLNWKQDEFISLLEAVDCSVCRYDNEDYSAGDFEVSAEQYEQAIKQVKAYVQDPENYQSDWMNSEDMRERIEATGETPEDMLRIMQGYYDEADKRDGYLHFSAF